MKIVLHKNKLINFIHNEKNLGFVPTMGAIHPGHISLIKRSIRECKKTRVSIFVNKPQFNRESDYKKYPRDLKKDISVLKKLNVDLLYLPHEKEIYPNGYNKKIKIISFKKKLCGKFRPGHFMAVVDVIDRFVKIIKPKRIYLGEKDMQQLKIIEDYIKKNHKEINVVPCRTIREKNGLPYSSRNINLLKNEKILASKVCKLIKLKKREIIKNRNKVNFIKEKIFNFGVNKIDYIKLININKIIKPFYKKNKYRVFIAFYVGKTRLIDNI